MSARFARLDLIRAQLNFGVSGPFSSCANQASSRYFRRRGFSRSDGTKAGGAREGYEEWGLGIADMINHNPPRETLVECLGVLEEQLGLPPWPLAERRY